MRYRGPVPQPQLGRVYSGLDALAMLLPSSISMTAGQGHDYMAARRPVIGGGSYNPLTPPHRGPVEILGGGGFLKKKQE